MTIQRFSEAGLKVTRRIRILLLVLMLGLQGPLVPLVPAYHTASAQAGLGEMNDGMEEMSSEIYRTITIILNWVVALAFLFMLINIVFKIVDNQKAIVGFFVVLVLRGFWELIN